MSEQAQAEAAASAQSASEAITALLTYVRQGGPIDTAQHYDMIYPLAVALRHAVRAVAIGRGGSTAEDDSELLDALTRWIEA